MPHAAADFVVPKEPVVTPVSDYGARRLIAIGDPHGCAREFTQLWERLDIKDDDIVVVLGDLIDRGPYSDIVLALVQYLCEHRAGTYCLMGNHCEKHARYRRHEVTKLEKPGYKNPMKASERFSKVHASLSDENLAWVAKLPQGIAFERHFHKRAEEGPVFLTHAGLINGFGFRQPVSGLIRNRYIKMGSDGRWTPVAMGHGFAQPEGSILWDEAWDPASGSVVYGHIVHDLKTPRVHNRCYGVDTGACFGGHLTAYVEDLASGAVEFCQVPAERAYYDKTTEEE